MIIGNSLRMPLAAQNGVKNGVLAMPGLPQGLQAGVHDEEAKGKARKLLMSSSDPHAAGAVATSMATASMKSVDPTFVLSKLLWSAQDDRTKTASADSTASSATKTAKATRAKEDTVGTFMKMSGMTLAEKVRAQVLERKHMSEESLAKADPETKADIEREIQKEVLRLFGADQAGEGAQKKDQAVAAAQTSAGHADVADVADVADMPAGSR